MQERLRRLSRPGRLHDEDGREAGAAQEPQRALVAFVPPLENRPLHGAIMGVLARPVHRTMVRGLGLGLAGLRRHSTDHFTRQNASMSSALLGPTTSAVAPTAAGRADGAGDSSAPSHGSGPCQTIVSWIA